MTPPNLAGLLRRQDPGAELTGARTTSPDKGSIHLPPVGSYFTSTQAPAGATTSAAKLPSGAAVVKTSLALLGLAT